MITLIVLGPLTLVSIDGSLGAPPVNSCAAATDQSQQLFATHSLNTDDCRSRGATEWQANFRDESAVFNIPAGPGSLRFTLSACGIHLSLFGHSLAERRACQENEIELHVVRTLYSDEPGALSDVQWQRLWAVDKSDIQHLTQVCGAGRADSSGLSLDTVALPRRRLPC